MYHPSRGGVRGGRDQFNWDDVKADKHRENYLGHSLKAPVGRWQKGKDLMWYARDTKETDEEAAASARAEIERVKQEEEEAMREALGLAPRRDKPRVNRLDKREQEELLKRSKAGEEADKPYAQGERIQGLGFAPVIKPVAPDTKDLLQRQAPLEEERPLAQVISQAHNRVAEKVDQEFATEDDSRQVSDDIDKKRKRKEEKRAAKEQRREEKKATKKSRREKRRRHTSISSDEELVDRKASRTKHRRHESDSSDQERDYRKDPKPESHKNARSHSSGDAGPHVSSRKARASDESDEDEPASVALGRKYESSRATSERDARSSHDDQRGEKKPSVEERERNYSRARDTSPRQRHGYDREERERSDRGGRSYHREVGSSRRGRDVDFDEDHRRQRGSNEVGRQEDDDLSRSRGDRYYSERRHRRSPSPPRRRPRHDSDGFINGQI